MLKKFWALLLIPLLAVTVFVGCSDDDPAGPSTDYLTSEEIFTAVATTGAAWLNSADAVGVKPHSFFDPSGTGSGFDDYLILDFRSNGDGTNGGWSQGHIDGAIQVTLANFLTTVEAEAPSFDTKIMCICFTGQSAGHAVAALRMLGYTDVYSYMYGMSAYNTNLDANWENNAGPANGNAAGDWSVNIVTTETPKVDIYDWPEITGLEVETPAEAVRERVEATLAAGFKARSLAAIMAPGEDELEDYFIVNYWSLVQYLGTDAASPTPGHIEGAYQFTPKASLAMDQDLDYLPSDGTRILVYCWTGQTSSQVVFYLNCLGYNAYSLSYGANNLFWEDIPGHQWSDAGMERPLVP